MKLKKGYWAKITTWENDADNYRTDEMQGLTEDAMRCLVQYCKLHRSKNAHGNLKGFGNMYEPYDYELTEYFNAIRALIATDRDNFRSLLGIENDEDENDHLGDFIGDFNCTIGIGGGEQFTRVFDSIEIFNVPEDIYIEDVTQNFWK